MNRIDKQSATISTYTLLGVAAMFLSLAGVVGFGMFIWQWFRAPEVQRDAPYVAQPGQRADVQFPPVRFTEITEKAGIRFQHTAGAFGRKLLPETMGAGVAFIDFDKDGKQDLLFVNSCHWPGYEDKTKPAPTLAFYRNKGNGEFEDVTEKVGLAITMYGQGVTVGDYDNDGWPDIFITGVGGNRLFRNVSDSKGGRRFEDVTASAGVGGPGGWPTNLKSDFLKWNQPLTWSSSAAFLDYDGDGLLDLFVCNYVTWSPEYDLSQGFTLGAVGRAYGQPKSFEGTLCFLYHNEGGGRFKDVSDKAGVQVKEGEGVGEGARVRSVGKSLGIIVCDVDDDGWPDVIVANDSVRNFFFHNQKDGTFKERGLLSGVAYPEGQARGGMGIDFAWYRPGQLTPGRLAVAISNFTNEPNTFLRLDDVKRMQFSDAALAEGISGPTRPLLKFGTFFFDYDLDGRPDMLVCNGHLEPEIARVQMGESYAQPAQLFWNTGQKSTFAPVPADVAGPDLFRPMVGRGCAYADIDGDGGLDVVLTENGGPARLLRNDGRTGNHWIRLILEGDGKRSNTSAIGAVVEVKAGDRIQRQMVLSSRGYLSQSELPLTFGLGTATKVDYVKIKWPGKNAGEQVLKEVPVDKERKVRQE